MNPQYLLYAMLFNAALVVALAVYEMGKKCARDVWAVAKKELDTDPMGTTVIVPFATATQSLFIFFAVMLRSPFTLALAAVRELRLEPWEKCQAMRDIDYNLNSTHDLLGAVSNMLSGYPERARSFYLAQRGHAMALRYKAYLDDHQAIEGTSPFNDTVIGQR